MENYYLWLILNVLLNELNYIFCKASISLNDFPIEDNPQGPNKEDFNDIFFKVDKLLSKEKELQFIYDTEYNKYINYQNQLYHQKIYLYFLIGITSLLFLILVIYSVYEYIKCKRKSKFEIQKEKYIKFKSINHKLISSSSSTFDSNEHTFSIEKISNNLGNKNEINNVNIDDKNGEIPAPIEYYKSENDINDEKRTLTNNEDINIESKVDKLLYNPYSKEKLND